jgi:hypothetical protein
MGVHIGVNFVYELVRNLHCCVFCVIHLYYHIGCNNEVIYKGCFFYNYITPKVYILYKTMKKSNYGKKAQ